MATMALKAAPHVSWYRTARGGMYALGTFIVVIAVFMAMRALGIGPVGSLLASGALKANDPILLADFTGPAADTSLAGVVTEALRSVLGESKTVSLVPVTGVRDMLQRMQRPPNQRVDFATARELATREGLKAIIDGEVLSLGTTRVVVTRLVATQTGEVLGTFSQTAKSDDEIVGAIDRVARDLRAKVGESLRAIHATPSYDRVTTPSFAAFKKYQQGDRLVSDGDLERGHASLEEAIALDSGFAMAYRRLAMSLSNSGTQTARVQMLIEKGYDHRERLGDVERSLLEGAYFDVGPKQDPAKAAAAYEATLELSPDNFTALNNLALIYRNERNFAKAEPLYRRAIAVDSLRNTSQGGLMAVLAGAGRLGEADQVAAHAERLFPRGPTPFASARVEIAWASGQLDSATVLAERLPLLAGRSARQRAFAAQTRSRVALARGKLGMARQLRGTMDSAFMETGSRATHLAISLGNAFDDVWLRNDRAAATRAIDAALAATPTASLDPVNRPHVDLVRALATVGRVDAAKAVLADFEETRRNTTLITDKTQRAQMTGDIAMAEKRYDAAAASYREAARPLAPWERLPDLARAYDLGGHVDSALAVYARYAAGSDYGRLNTDATYLGPSLKRLGELYEEKGDRDNAAKAYARFIELWKNADPELQPHVTEARRRLEKLAPVEKPR
jgi:tetratricopeptide (TPR) repeat protein